MREIIERTAHNKINPSARAGNIKERLTWLSSSKEMILDVGCGNIPRGDVNVDLCVPNDILKGKGLARRYVIETTNPKKIPNFIKADAHYLPFRSNSFSKVFCAHVIEHLEYPQKALLEMLRVSKSTVEIIVSIWQVDFVKYFFNPRLISWDKTHRRHKFTLSGIKKMLGSYLKSVKILKFKGIIPYELLVTISKLWKRRGTIYISIIVPTLNEEKHIAYLLASLKMQTYPNFEVIVVDGGSKDQTIEIVRKYGAKTIVLPGYREFPSRNVGASIAMGEILLFTCADVIFPKDLLAKICEKFERDPQLLAVSGPSVPYDAPLMGKIMYGIYNIIRDFSSKLPGKLRRFSTSTNFLAVRREAFEKTGGFLDDINADGLMGRKLIKMGKVDFDIKLYVYISARRMKNMGLSKFITHYLYILENFFPFLSRTNLIKGFKKRSRSIHRKLHEHT